MNPKFDTQAGAIALILIGCAVALVAYLCGGPETGKQALFQIATTIIGGALGVYVSQSKSKADIDTGGAPATINQGDTVVSPQPKN